MKCCERDHDSDGNCDRHPARPLRSQPNFQNIPVRTEEGRRIRELFRTKYAYVDFDRIERDFVEKHGREALTNIFKKET